MTEEVAVDRLCQWLCTDYWLQCYGETRYGTWLEMLMWGCGTWLVNIELIVVVFWCDY